LQSRIGSCAANLFYFLLFGSVGSSTMSGLNHGRYRLLLVWHNAIPSQV